jgi:branched-chain amino acid transport system substrate-binding protein
MARRRWLALVAGSIAAASALVASGAAGGASGGRDPAGEPIVIGFISPLSEPGDFRSGRDNLRAARVWVKYVNDHGGILGRPVKLEIGDDKGAPETGASEARRLITQKKVIALVGMWNSSTTLAQMEIAKRYNVPIFSHYSWSDDITKKGYDQVFRVGPYNSEIAELFVPYLRHKRYKRVAVLAEDTDYGIGFARSLAKATKGKPKVDIVQFQAQTKDLTPELSKLASRPPDAIIIASAYEAENLSIKQAREVGLKSDIIAGWDYPTLPGFWDVVGEAGVGVVYPTFYAAGKLPLTRTGKTLGNVFKKATGRVAVIYHYLLWDALNAIKWAIEKTKSTSPGDLVKVLPSANYEGTTGRITFTNKRGTVLFHQWEGHVQFFKQLTKRGQTDAQAKVVFAARKTR